MRDFLDKGHAYVGIEINEDMVNLGRSNLERMGYVPPEILVGNNSSLPLPDNSVDLLVAINTIHYSYGAESFLALKEYSRVINSGGYAVIETAGQKHDAVKRSNRIDELTYQWGIDGFRLGEKFGFFDSLQHFEYFLNLEFQNVEVSSRLECYPNRKLEFYVGVCKK